MILLIDNYDSFTYNLVQCLGQLDPEIDLRVVRNDHMNIDQLAELSPTRLIISPGPCTPKEAGLSVDCVRHFAGRIPILGVCLGHQAIGAAFGAEIVPAHVLMHGKTDQIHHNTRGLFAGLPNPLQATRYHSLVIDPATLNENFEVTAWANADDGHREIMAIQHRELPIFGVQFHPESFLTIDGARILAEFLKIGGTRERGDAAGAHRSNDPLVEL